MGLQHKAIHAMLANPHLAPFELIDLKEGRSQTQDFTLIDHLMVIHKVRKDDYLEGYPQPSIASMAATLAFAYSSEGEGSRCVVLVKDGPGAQKPAVREVRRSRPPAPHIQFCKRNLPAIEYNMLKMLADMGMKDKFFLVTGARGDRSASATPSASVDNLVSFHEKYLAQRADAPAAASDTDSDTDGHAAAFSMYADGAVERPPGAEGVFVATFADPAAVPQASALREACLRCQSTEADTLLMELANVLTGSVTVCTGDSDAVAVLAACGREGITLRLDNKSYHETRDMHASTFGDLLFDSPENRVNVLTREPLDSTKRRLRALCDVAKRDRGLVPQVVQRQHERFEELLVKHGEVNLSKNAARYLYLGGIRGSLYGAFLSRLFQSEKHTGFKIDSFQLAVAEDRIGANTVRYIFETLCPAAEAADERAPTAGRKRKSSSLDEVEEGEEEEEEEEEDDFLHMAADQSKEERRVVDGMKRLSKTYRLGMVPKGSYGRFLRLNRAGDHFFLQAKTEVIRDEAVRAEKLFFMALCGTDYNVVPRGLGIKRLMTGAVTKRKAFSAWCRDMRGLLWDSGAASPSDCQAAALKLAAFTKVPPTTVSKYWTEETCALTVKTMKYVCELWGLKRPSPGPEYGLVVRDDGVVDFDREEPVEQASVKRQRKTE